MEFYFYFNVEYKSLCILSPIYVQILLIRVRMCYTRGKIYTVPLVGRYARMGACSSSMLTLVEFTHSSDYNDKIS